MSPAKDTKDDGPRIMPFPVALHYEMPAAPAITRYGEALIDGRIIGQRCTGDCGLVYVPPRDYCPIDVIELTAADDVELGDHGTIVNFTVVTPVQYPGQEETEPFARVSIALDGPGGMLQLQDVLDTPVSEVRVGMRVAAVWRPEGERNLDELAAGGWSSTGGGIEGWMPTGEPDLDVSSLAGKGF
jgi:uncharacterized OB-fold protein